VLASDDVERLRALVTAFAGVGDVGSRWAAQRITVTSAEGGKVEHVSKSVNGTQEDSVRRLWHDWFLMSVRASFDLLLPFNLLIRHDKIITTVDHNQPVILVELAASHGCGISSMRLTRPDRFLPAALALCDVCIMWCWKLSVGQWG